MTASNDDSAGATLPVVTATPAGLVRRLGAMLYDTLLVIAVLMIATIPFLPFAAGRALVPQEVGWPAYVYRAWVVLVIVLFFGFFWTRRGQTVGMQAWRLRVEDEQGATLTWPLAVKRLIFATLPWLPSWLFLGLAERFKSPLLKWLGVGLLLLGAASLATVWFESQGRTWYERRAKS